MDHSTFKHKIFGGDFKAIEITLEPNQQIEALAENLIYKEKGIEIERVSRKIGVFKNSAHTPQIVTFLYEVT